jgi:hypothetical protein
MIFDVGLARTKSSISDDRRQRAKFLTFVHALAALSVWGCRYATPQIGGEDLAPHSF